MLSSRLEAIQIARAKLALSPLYLDTETTGIERNSEIIEVSVVDDSGNLVYESLVKPSRPIPRDVIRIHGITDQDVKDAPSWLMVWPKLENVLAGHTVGIYNAEFDLRMLQQTHARYRIPLNSLPFSYFCIMKLYAQYYGEWNRSRGGYRWHSLEDAGRYCQIPLQNTHRAFDDSLLARAVLHYVAEDRRANR
jgi:DNA polymerase III epsilon subunit-like protein